MPNQAMVNKLRWELLKALDDDNPWNAPGPKRDFILS
jgi:hypothetical protein